MNSNIDITEFYGTITQQEKYFTWLRTIMEVISVINMVLVIFSVYIIRKFGSGLKSDYRQVLLVNQIFPSIFSWYMGFIYQPYIIFPYHFLLTIGFFRFGPYVTAHLFNICCSLAILTSMGLIYSFYHNYITICFRVSKQNSTKSNGYGLLIGLIFTILNFLLMTLGVSDRQYEDWDYFFNIDDRNREFFEKYSIAVVRVADKWSLKVLSIEAFIGISIVVIVIPIITIKSHTTLNGMHNVVSRTTLTHLQNALTISLWYLLQFGLLVGVPAATAMGLLLTHYTPSHTFPLAMVVLIPTQLTCPVICILYLTVIKPLRYGTLRFFGLKKMAPKGISQMSTQSHFSTGPSYVRRSNNAPYSTMMLH